jgi:hypothetical protein
MGRFFTLLVNSVNNIDMKIKQNMIPRQIFILLLAAFFGNPPLHAQAPDASTILDSYIRIGLDSNLALHQRNFDWQKAQLDLKRAKTFFYPQMDFSSQYTAANGGRSQSIPVGDLLNGVYSTLNQLTGTNKFPQVANQNIQFLPNDYHVRKWKYPCRFSMSTCNTTSR